MSSLLPDQYVGVVALRYFRLIVSNGRKVLLSLILIVIKCLFQQHQEAVRAAGGMVMGVLALIQT